MNINWLADMAKNWIAAEDSGRMPHAVLLGGPAGVGKRAAAAWMAARKLGLATTSMPQYPFEIPEHADLHWVAPHEEKSSILIDQVRVLIDDFGLTSYSGRGKVAVIVPADGMTNNAANSLLKTLEEPSGEALLILVADRAGRLPATIFSRCQRIECRVPAEADGLSWLRELTPGDRWAEPLRTAGGAPLAAIRAAGQVELTATLARDFAALAAGSASPVDTAAAWSKLDTGTVLEWLARTLTSVLRRMSGGPGVAAGPEIPDSVLQRIDSRNLFCYLDIINRLRGQPKGSYNVQVALEGLLIDWATGLTNMAPPNTPDGLLLMQGRLSGNEA